MNKLLFILALFGISFFSTAQERDPGFRPGVAVFANASSVTAAFTPAFTWSSDKHYFAIGPKAWPYYFYDNHYGLDLTYKIFPNPAQRVLNMYFVFYYELDVIQYQYYIDPSLNNIHATNNLMAGYGFDIRMRDHFYFTHHIGAGVMIDNGFDELSFMLHLGVGYRF